MKQNLPRIVIGLLILAIFLAHAASIMRISVIDRIDQAMYDMRLRATLPRTMDDRVVILDIDEKSLAEVGHWPWSRDKMATIIDKLFTVQKIAIVGFDVAWPERDPSSGLARMDQLAHGELKDNAPFIAELDRLRPALDYDGLFVNSIRNRAVVLGYFLSNQNGNRVAGKLPEPVLPAGTFGNRPIVFTVWDSYSANLPELQDAALAAGHLTPVLDNDGVVRRIPMLAEYNHQYYEALSLAMVRAILGSPGLQPGYPDDLSWVPKSYSGLESLDMRVSGKLLRIPVDRNVTTLVPYRGAGNAGGGSYRYVSLSDVLNDRLKPGELAGKICLVGTTALGLQDMRSTPVGEVFPGVEVHANLISGMLDGTLKEAPDYTLGAEVAMLLVVGLTLSFALPYLSAVRAVALAVLLGVILVAFNLYIFSRGNLVLPLASSLLLLGSIFTLDVTYGYFVESRSKRQLAGLFGSYVPPELVEEMSRNPENYSMEGRQEDLTVMFSDVRGFTTISEALNPKDLGEYINEYLTSMSVLIQASRGTIDKYIGDAIMAFWGAPVADAKHAQQAVETAMAMQKEVVRLNEAFRARNWPDMHIGVGVSSGPMKVGDMGSKIRRAYTVMGDAVNLGSRLESLTKNYGIGILVAEATRKTVYGIVFREIDKVQVKGKEEPVTIFEPMGREGEVDKSMLDEIKLWQQTLKAYRAQQWDQAELQLMNLLRMSPESGLYKEYVKRIANYRVNPPEDGWGGVTKFTEK